VQLSIELAITDPLTGLSNRRYMESHVGTLIEQAATRGKPLTVLVIDIDYFKRVNDEFGHLAGDQVLQGLVNIIMGRARKLDRLFRMGGEEFLLFLPDTRAGDAVTRAENLRMMVAAAPLLAKRPVTISIGVSEIAGDDIPETWIARADEALYAAKQSGRNKVVNAHIPPQTAAVAAPALQ